MKSPAPFQTTNVFCLLDLRACVIVSYFFYCEIAFPFLNSSSSGVFSLYATHHFFSSDAYVVVAFSIVATIFIHIMQCTTSKILRCGMVGRWADSLLAMVMCLWWSVACGVISVGVGNANGKDLPKNNWRTATLILFWIQFLVYLLIAVAGATRNGMK